MTLARQQWLFLALALALLIAFSVGLLINQQRVGRALADLERSHEVVNTVVRMRNLAVEVTTNRTERQEIQWRAGMREFANALQALTLFAEEALLIQKIKSDVDDADQLFHRLIARDASAEARSAAGDGTGMNLERIATALHFVLGDVSLMALQLSELQTAEVRAARLNVRRTSTLMVAAMLIVLVAYLMVFRKLVLAPIVRLQAATDRIAGGELAYRVGLSAANELGELARQFDHMTETLQAAQARLVAANQEMESFTYSISHDLRAPLRGMDGFSRILLEKYAQHMEGDALHCLHMIRDNAQQMGRLIDDLLQFSRLGRQPLKTESVKHEALVRAALQGLEVEQNGRRVDLTLDELPAAEADPRLLKQVWINLLSNALKYTRGRDLAVIRVGCETQNGVPVYFVRDNGVGFDMRYADKLFGVFQRLHRAEDYEGTGVGLAIVQRIISRHGGRVWAQAVKNEGATFYFTLQKEHDNG